MEYTISEESLEKLYKQNDTLEAAVARLTAANDYANNLLEEQGAHINEQSLKITNLNKANESMQEDAVQNTITVKMLMAQLSERDKEVLQLKEKVRYAYVQIEALEEK